MIIPEIRIGEIATIITLLITLYFIIRYTRATVKYAKATVDMRDLEVGPIVIFRVHEDNDKFYIKNFGKFPALDIEISQFSYRDPETKKLYELKFEKVNDLLPDEEKKLKYKNLIDGEEPDKSMKVSIFAYIHPRYQKEADIPFKITYKNIMGEKYATHFITGKSGIVIKPISRI